MDKYKEEEHSQSRLHNDILFLPVLNKGRSVNYLQRQKTILRISTHTWRSLSQAISLRQGRKRSPNIKASKLCTIGRHRI